MMRHLVAIMLLTASACERPTSQFLCSGELITTDSEQAIKVEKVGFIIQDTTASISGLSLSITSKDFEHIYLYDKFSETYGRFGRLSGELELANDDTEFSYKAYYKCSEASPLH